MKKLISLLCVMCMATVFVACGDETTEVIGYPDGGVVKNLGYDLDVCVTHDDCGERQLCTVDMDVTEAAGFTVMVCVTACDAELATVETQNEDGTSSSVTTKVEGTDTCQRYENMDLFCDMSKHVCAEYTMEEPEPTPEPTPVPTPEPIDDGLRYVEYCYSGGSFAGLWGQIAWIESTPYDPEAWKPGRDLTIVDGCFGTTVIWAEVLIEEGYKTFYSDMTNGVHTGNAAIDSALMWLAMNWYPDTCSVDGVLGLLGDYVQDKGHPCLVPE